MMMEVSRAKTLGLVKFCNFWVLKIVVIDCVSMFCMTQVWNPLGIVGVITAFNFPCAVLGQFFLLNCFFYEPGQLTIGGAAGANILYHKL
jgi:hypothetical protein